MSGLVDNGQQGNPFIFSQPQQSPGMAKIGTAGAILSLGQQLGEAGTFSALGLKPARFKSPQQHQSEREQAADAYYNAAISGDQAAYNKLYLQAGLANPGSFGGKNCPQNPGGVCYGAATSKARAYFEQRYLQATEVLKSKGVQGNPNTLGTDKMNVAPGNFLSGFGFPKDVAASTEEALGIPLPMLLVLGAGLLLLRKGMR